jgi:hypothetical protein
MIVSVTGHADTYDLVFKQGQDGIWAVSVPPDLSDGRYVCDIYVTDSVGKTAYWTGILYMTDGRFVCLLLLEDSITAYLLPERHSITDTDVRIIAEISDDHISINILGERVIERLIRRCRS